ncbi:putative transcription factor interactor and regulator CCHC(Zn) family [Rosa chinensis]|uniref:Putative transcription factor interactor and regulator CCHC(Zn) family n=1 Tax=Rosa chinensis TaxID=74649 RepID=A0A2P6RA53_ROSCH|nr:putative transcription factor interactor and regulator CCHC(Zn) family [Rosa chinensis]
MDYDIVLREEEPAPITEASTDEQKKKFEKWEKANRMALLIMKKSVAESVRGAIPSGDKAKAFLEAVREKFKESDKAEATNLMHAFSNLKYDERKGVRVHILKLIEIASKLNGLAVPVPEPLLVYQALHSLPPKFAQLQVAYNTQKGAWDLNELISICSQEEERLKQEKVENVNLVHSGHGKKNGASSSSKFPNAAKPSGTVAKSTHLSHKGSHNFKSAKNKNFKCFFCKKPNHMKKDCEKYKKWLAKKGIHKEEVTN